MLNQIPIEVNCNELIEIDLRESLFLTQCRVQIMYVFKYVIGTNLVSIQYGIRRRRYGFSLRKPEKTLSHQIFLTHKNLFRRISIKKYFCKFEFFNNSFFPRTCQVFFTRKFQICRWTAILNYARNRFSSAMVHIVFKLLMIIRLYPSVVSVATSAGRAVSVFNSISISHLFPYLDLKNTLYLEFNLNESSIIRIKHFKRSLCVCSNVFQLHDNSFSSVEYPYQINFSLN